MGVWPIINLTISHFEIHNKLSEDDMGVVYKAQDTKLDRPVVIKFLNRKTTSYKDVKIRFKLEPKAVPSLND